MVCTPSQIPARFSLRVDDDLLPALPVHLSGHEAALVLDHALRLECPVRLLVDWDAGGHTELSASIRAVGQDGRLTHLDLHGVGGDWRPFLAWLGTRACA